MVKPIWMMIALMPLLECALVFCPHSGHAAEVEAEVESKTACRVRTAPVRRAALEVDIAASGTVTTAPEALRSIVVAYDCRIRRVLVQAGQEVAAGAKLLEIEPSFEANAQRAEVVAVRDAAVLDANQTKQRFDQHLATLQDLTQAQQTLALATQRVTTWNERISADSVIVAPAAGVVTKLDIQAGHVITAGTPLVELTDAGHLVARIGVDPGDVHMLSAGQAVHLLPIRRQDGTVSAVDAQLAHWETAVEPETRLVAAVIPIPAGADLLRGEAVQAHIVLALPESLVVPRVALVADDAGGWVVFTVHEGKAGKHAVAIVGENRSDSAITGDGIAVGDAVVIEGGPELEEGMAVESAVAP